MKSTGAGWSAASGKLPGRGLVVLASLVVAGATACSKQPEKVVTSCAISFEGDKVAQCFEYTTEAAKKAVLAEQCNEFEGKTTYRDGPCPAEGRGGACVRKILDQESVSHCYRDTESCRKSCDGAGSTFKPN